MEYFNMIDKQDGKTTHWGQNLWSNYNFADE